MKLFHSFAAFTFAASLAIAPALAQSSNLFEFDGGIGAQPFRSSAGAPILNTVAGVNPGGAPWVISSLRVVIGTDGSIRARGRGLLLAGGDNLGTRGGPRQVLASLFCRNAPVAPAPAGSLQTIPYNSAFVDLDENGDFQISGQLIDANGGIPSASCGNTIDNRPVLLIRTVVPANPSANPPTAATPGVWFAAGTLKSGLPNFRN